MLPRALRRLPTSPIANGAADCKSKPISQDFICHEPYNGAGPHAQSFIAVAEADVCPPPSHTPVTKLIGIAEDASERIQPRLY